MKKKRSLGMTPKRSALRLRSPGQYDALIGSPARTELLEALQVASGPLSVAELARRVGRKPSALYHHLKRLVDAGIVVVAGRGRSGPRSQALYAPAARRIEIAFEPEDEDTVDAFVRGARAVLRLAERDFRRCVEDAAERGASLPKALDTVREKAWLNAKDLAELHRRVQGLRDFLKERSRPGRGRLVALTLSAAELPAPHEDPQSKRDAR